MNAAVIAVLTLVLVMVLAAAAALVVVVASIRGDERRMSLRQPPRTRAGAVTRRVLGAHVTTDQNVHRARADARS
jgi:hypothetical protein